jgi:hypothetical protein
MLRTILENSLGCSNGLLHIIEFLFDVNLGYYT